MQAKVFTIEQANKMLPLVRCITADIMSTWEEILTRRQKIDEFQAMKIDCPEFLKEEINYLIDKINKYIKEMEDLGCYVEEFRRGIINFPSLSNGRKVFLNWYPQDTKVSYAHEIDDTFEHRAPAHDVFRGTPTASKE